MAGDRAKSEEKILQFWQERQIFKKSLEKPGPKGEFVFYEGPPTANGRPGIHHLEARAFKDLIPRFKTMQGYRVRRKAGWDTHGLPVELEVEKQLGLKSKKEIEQYGIAEFNKKCVESVWKYLDEWQKFTSRVGYWVDQEHPYITYKSDYIETVWGIVKKINERGLLYQDYKVVPWCPRCGTALSSHELAQGYADVTDLSVYAKFKIKDKLNTYLLAWTTTPWTLPGNVALAVGESFEYVEAKLKETGEVLILAQDRLSVLPEDSYVVQKTLNGKDLVGMQYEPLFDYPNLQNEKSHRVYTADFVTTTDGTGIVHTAVMCGQDDFELGTQVGLPKHHLVGEDGKFLPEAGELTGKFVRDEETAVWVIKNLAARSLLFKKEKYKHAYPHCWRCKTPLVYYARSSWYIAMSKLRDELVRENEKINWEPAHIREGRFGEWLREVKDWAISRERYWGTPLPVWRTKDGAKLVIGSVEELKARTKKSGNKYFVMRHGEAESNARGVIDSTDEQKWPLTKLGKEQVDKASETLVAHKITKIYASPFARTRETAELLAKKLGLSKQAIVYDNRLRELDFGKLHTKTFAEFLEYEDRSMPNYADPLPGGESYLDAKRRFGEFLYEIEGSLHNESVLIVTHGVGTEVLEAVVQGADSVKSKQILEEVEPAPGMVRQLNFTPLPHNDDYELDLHRPYIDQVALVNEKGAQLERVKEVMDVWFDSGAMPFAQEHDLATRNYPADYICEAIDQTRGWFYTLHAIGVLMERGLAYKNVICLGHLLDKEGKKMSKSVGNVVNPWEMIEKYGVDVLRFWLYSVNAPGDSKNFDEKTVAEVTRKVPNLLLNVLAFYQLYADEKAKGDELERVGEGDHVLDQWIVARLNRVVAEVTTNLEAYKVLESARSIRDFIADLSQWHLRRSRERFKSDDIKVKNAALHTTRHVITTLAKIMAPFTPFLAEEIYQQVKKVDDPESVHLATWPVAGVVDERLLSAMDTARHIVSLGLEERTKVGLKIRQPLTKITIKTKIPSEYFDLIKDELNVKEIVFDLKAPENLVLDTTVTPELKREGQVREFVRQVQDLRKQAGLQAQETVTLVVSASSAGRELLTAQAVLIKKAVNAREVVWEASGGEPVTVDELEFGVALRRG